MRKTSRMCTIAAAVFAASAIVSLRAEAMTVGSLTEFRAAIQETNLIQNVGYDGYYEPYAYYPWYGYYRTVCRAWWKGCRLEVGHYSNVWPNRYYYYRPSSYGYR